MDSIQDLLRKRLSIQHRGKNMIGSIALSQLKTYLHLKSTDSNHQDEILIWYVRYNKLFIKTPKQEIKIQIFKEKTLILDEINLKLISLWYKTTLQDIILK